MVSVCEKSSTLYEWAYRTGKLLYDLLLKKHGDPERARNELRVFLLNLRSEQIPERFRKILVDYVVSIASTGNLEISFPKKIKIEDPWTVDEFYRYSTCLLYTSPSPRDLSTSRMPSSA